MSIFEQMKKDAETIREGMRLAQKYHEAGFILADVELLPLELCETGEPELPEPAAPRDPEPEPPTEPPTPEWPKTADDGALYDSRGMPWIEAAHSAGKTCTTSGEWRRRKGVSSDEVERLEREVMGESNDDPGVTIVEVVAEPTEPSSPVCYAPEFDASEQPTEEPCQDDIPTGPAPEALPAESGGTVSSMLVQIENGIANAPDRETIDEQLAKAIGLNVYPATYARLEEAAEKRLRELIDLAGDSFESIREAIEQAESEEEIAEWLERIRHIVLPQSKKYALMAVADERRRQLGAAASM